MPSLTTFDRLQEVRATFFHDYEIAQNLGFKSLEFTGPWPGQVWQCAVPVMVVGYVSCEFAFCMPVQSV